MRWRSYVAIAVAIAFIAVAPAMFGSFTITLMNYIGIYAIAALGLVLLTGDRRPHLVRPGRLRRHRRLCDGLVHRGAGRLAVDRPAARAGADRRWSRRSSARRRLRLSGHFLPLSTIAWGIAIYFVFGNLDALDRYSGLSGIPPISIGPISLERHHRDLLFHLGRCSALVMLLCRNLLDSRQGRAIRSLRGGIAMVESLAIDCFRMRLAVFVLAGAARRTVRLALSRTCSGIVESDAVRHPTRHRTSVHGAGRRRRPDRRRRGRRRDRRRCSRTCCRTCFPPITRYSAQLEVRVLRRAVRHPAAEGARRHRADDPALSAAARSRPLPVAAPPLPRRARPAVAGRAGADDRRRDQAVRRTCRRQRGELRGHGPARCSA